MVILGALGILARCLPPGTFGSPPGSKGSSYWMLFVVSGFGFASLVVFSGYLWEKHRRDKIVGSDRRSTGDVSHFVVFGRFAEPTMDAVREVCAKWVKANPRANPSRAKVLVNIGTSEIWMDQHVRAHYALLHYRGRRHTWEIMEVSNDEYLLLVVFS
jgi:hypothetical protein